MTTENKAEKKNIPISKPLSLKQFKKNRALSISDYISRCISADQKIDKAFIKELGEIA